MQYRQIGRLLLVLHGQLFLQDLEALLQMRATIFFQLVVHLPRAGPDHAGSKINHFVAIARVNLISFFFFLSPI